MMKVGILAGGLGTRLSEETTIKPKPMVEIGGRPLLWHIMNIYAHYGFKEFVIALGYKGEIIKEYFLNYHHHSRSLTVNLKTGDVIAHQRDGEDWIVHLLDTGTETNTGGRVKQMADFIGKETFMMTYGDGVCNINILRLIAFHKAQKRLVTMTAARPPARFGQMLIQDHSVIQFKEKPQLGEGWINGGFFVLEPEITKYIENESTAWEFESLEQIAADGQLAAYPHEDFWQCMDTLRDVHLLEKLWQEGNAPWKLWS
jgi:glucose-1-phosphate cytidylyltransferase